MIVTGALDVDALLAGIPALRSLLLAVGAVFLLFLAWGSYRRSTTDRPTVDDGCPLPQVAAKIAGASLLNPHAILDTVVVIGATIATQRDDVRLLFLVSTDCRDSQATGVSHPHSENTRLMAHVPTVVRLTYSW